MIVLEYKIDKERQLAKEMFDQMSDENRLTYTDEGWFSGICNNCLKDENPEIVGDELHALVMDWQNNNELEVVHEFAFDVKLWAVVRVKAGGEERAREILNEFATCMDIGLVADSQNRSDLHGRECIKFTEASSEGDADLFEVDGEDV